MLMKESNIDGDLNIYAFAELRYEEENKEKDDIYPDGWYLIDDYVLKTKIITEAIKKRILIKDTDLYKKHSINEENK